MRPWTNDQGLRDWMPAPWEAEPSRWHRLLDWWHRTFDILWVRR